MTSNAAIARDERAQWSAARAALDPFRPQGFFMEEERGATGELVSTATLFLTNRECPWRCVYCDLWKHTRVDAVPPGAIPKQLDFVLERMASSDCRQIKLYNAGSFFDPNAVPPEDFAPIAERVARFERVIVESHPALIGSAAIHFQRRLKPRLEVAMGLEAADDALLAKLNKRMTLEMFRRAAAFLVERGIDVRAFVIVKPPFVRTDRAAAELAQRSVEFAFDCGATVVSLIPARFGAAALRELASEGEFSPPRLETVEEVIDRAATSARGRVFVDLWDVEQLDGCVECRAARIARLRAINHRQQFIPRISCAQCR